MIDIIVNSNSQNSIKKLTEVEKYLANENIEYKIFKTSSTSTAYNLMKDVTSDKIIVIGGDGTINEVVNNYHNEQIIYIARGSGNDLARSLGLSCDIVNIAKQLESNTVEFYDVGEVNGKKFCSGFDLGFNADIIAREKSSKLKKYLNRYIYLYCGIMSILKLKKYKVKLECEEEQFESENVYLLNVMVQPYEGGGIKFSPNATGKDGLLHAMVMKDMSFLNFVYNYICLLLKKHNSLRGVQFIKTKKLTITTNQEYYQFDGELEQVGGRLSIECKSKFYRIKR